MIVIIDEFDRVPDRMAQQAWDRIGPHIDANDFLLIIEIRDNLYCFAHVFVDEYLRKKRKALPQKPR